jgi:hypothetical protein
MARTWAVELGLVWEKLRQLVRYRRQDLVGQLRAPVAIETVPAVVQESQAMAAGRMDYLQLENKHSPVFVRQAQHVHLRIIHR